MIPHAFVPTASGSGPAVTPVRHRRLERLPNLCDRSCLVQQEEIPRDVAELRDLVDVEPPPLAETLEPLRQCSQWSDLVGAVGVGWQAGCTQGLRWPPPAARDILLALQSPIAQW